MLLFIQVWVFGCPRRSEQSKSRTNAAARLNAAGECANQLRELRAARKVRGRVHLEAARLELGKSGTRNYDDAKMNIA